MFGDMLFPGKRFQIADFIIQRVSVPVMDDFAWRNGSILSLPNHNGAEAPGIRIGRFHKSPIAPLLVRADRDRAYRHSPLRRSTFLEFGRRGEVQAFNVFVPRFMAFCESIRRRLACSEFIACLVVTRHTPNAHMPLPTTYSTAEPSRRNAVWFNLKRSFAYFAYLCDHVCYIGMHRSKVNRCSSPSPKPEQIGMPL
mgnify:CR=1 FL=1